MKFITNNEVNNKIIISLKILIIKNKIGLISK